MRYEEIEWIWNKLDVLCKMIHPWIETTLKFLKALYKSFYTYLKIERKRDHISTSLLNTIFIKYYNSAILYTYM